MKRFNTALGCGLGPSNASSPNILAGLSPVKFLGYESRIVSINRARRPGISYLVETLRRDENVEKSGILPPSWNLFAESRMSEGSIARRKTYSGRYIALSRVAKSAGTSGDTMRGHPLGDSAAVRFADENIRRSTGERNDNVLV